VPTTFPTKSPNVLSQMLSAG